MKKIFALCAVVLAAAVAGVYRTTRLPDRFGTFTGAPRASAADLVARPKDFLKKTVALEGIVREQCETMGCYFYFHEGRATLRVDLQDIAMNAPRGKNGRPARVEGQLESYGDGYQLLATAVAFE